MLDYNYINKYYKIIEKELRKQQALDADPKAILSSSRRKLKYNNVFKIEVEKETNSDFSQGTVKALQIHLVIIIDDLRLIK